MHYMQAYQIVNILIERGVPFKMTDRDTFQVTDPKFELTYIVSVGARKITVTSRELNIALEALDSTTLIAALDEVDNALEIMTPLDLVERVITSTSKRFNVAVRGEDEVTGAFVSFEEGEIKLSARVTDSYFQIRSIGTTVPELTATFYFDKVSLFEGIIGSVKIIDRI